MYEMTEKKAEELKKALDLVKYAINDVDKVLSNIKRNDEAEVKMAMVVLRDYSQTEEIGRFEILFNSVKDRSIIKIYNPNTAYFDYYVFSSSNGYTFIYIKSNELEVSNARIRKGVYRVED